MKKSDSTVRHDEITCKHDSKFRSLKAKCKNNGLEENVFHVFYYLFTYNIIIFLYHLLSVHFDLVLYLLTFFHTTYFINIFILCFFRLVLITKRLYYLIKTTTKLLPLLSTLFPIDTYIISNILLLFVCITSFL